MSGSEELYPPAQYGGGWILVAILIIATLLLAAWLLVFLTRPRRAAPRDASVPRTPQIPPDVFTQLRREYLAQIDRIEADHRTGELEERGVHLALSRSVRAFVNEYSGLEAPVLTLDDLVARGVHPALIEALRTHYYPGIFRRGPVIDPGAGAEAARTVVNTWR